MFKIREYDFGNMLLTEGGAVAGGVVYHVADEGAAAGRAIQVYDGDACRMGAKRVDEAAQVVGAEQNSGKPRHLIGYAQHYRLVVA